MKNVLDVARELDGMAETGKSMTEVAELLVTESRDNPALLKMVGNLCKNWEKLLTVDNLRRWPEKHADVLAAFFLNLPCRPRREAPPCGRKELLLADALRDAVIPKAVRIHLWRCLVMDGFILPCYTPDVVWDVPIPLYDHPAVRNWLCQTKHDGWEDLRCSDPQLFFRTDVLKQFKTDAEKKALEAIDKDSPSGLLMPLSIEGRNLPAKYAQAALMKNAVRIVTYLFCNNSSFAKMITPRQLLFYVCANWNNDETIPLVAVLEKENPGLVKDSIDAFGHDALWYTLYQRDRFNRATEAAKRAMDPLDRTLIEFGCDPNRTNDLGLSYNDLTI